MSLQRLPPRSASDATPLAGHPGEIARRLAAAEARCRAVGERWTSPRARALELLLEAGRPMGAYDLVVAFKTTGYTHPPTIYRALDFLVAHGLAHHLRSRNRFVACSHGAAAHAPLFLLCEACGRAEERPLGDTAALTAAAEARGFLATGWTLEVHGRCPACAGAST